jgi:fructoselysine-6-P-deglycase FrlB-like protein
MDFESQIKELDNIDYKKKFDDCIFVGSGDSYVAGLITEYLTNHKCTCYSPSDLIDSLPLQNKVYCFVSVTGKTRANIEVAQRAKKAGIRTLALTLNTDSKLARACDEVIPLKITSKKTPTAGYRTFTANVVACLQLAGIAVPKNFAIWHKNGIQLAANLKSKSATVPKGVLYVLGNAILYPLALYTSLQLAEFFGTTAVANKLEEFCHSPVFGAKKTDNLWILGQNENENAASQRLAQTGFDVAYFQLHNPAILAQLFESIFFLQSLILLLAQRNGYTELEFVLKQDVLRASSDIIYEGK